MNTSAISELTGLALVLGAITAASIVADLARRQRTWRAHRRFMNRTVPRPTAGVEHSIEIIGQRPSTSRYVPGGIIPTDGGQYARCRCETVIYSPKKCSPKEAARALKFGIDLHTTQTAKEASC